MKKLLILLILTAVPVIFGHDAAAAQKEPPISQEIGRYQLFQGTYSTIDLKYRQSSSTYSAVFLIDTATGIVKRYVNRIDEDGKYVETWLPTEITQQLDMKK